MGALQWLWGCLVTGMQDELRETHNRVVDTNHMAP
jgi:hypothetical protein